MYKGNFLNVVVGYVLGDEASPELGLALLVRCRCLQIRPIGRKVKNNQGTPDPKAERTNHGHHRCWGIEIAVGQMSHWRFSDNGITNGFDHRGRSRRPCSSILSYRIPKSVDLWMRERFDGEYCNHSRCLTRDELTTKVGWGVRRMVWRKMHDDEGLGSEGKDETLEQSLE